MVRTNLGPASAANGPWHAEAGQEIGLDLDARCSPDRAGGDLFDAVRIGSRVAFLLSDIAGRRPELDPIAASIKEAFRRRAPEYFGDPGANLMDGTELLVQAINQALISAASGVRFTPTVVGCYDAQLGVLAYINAGGQTALLGDAEGVRPLPNVSMPLGLFPHLTYDASMQAFEPGATLLVVTKGVSDSLAGPDSSKTKRLADALGTANDGPAGAGCQAVLDAAQGSAKQHWGWVPFRNKLASNDMTALVMRRTSPAG